MYAVLGKRPFLHETALAGQRIRPQTPVVHHEVDIYMFRRRTISTPVHSARCVVCVSAVCI